MALSDKGIAKLSPRPGTGALASQGFKFILLDNLTKKIVYMI